MGKPAVFRVDLQIDRGLPLEQGQKFLHDLQRDGPVFGVHHLHRARKHRRPCVIYREAVQKNICAVRKRKQPAEVISVVFDRDLRPVSLHVEPVKSIEGKQLRTPVFPVGIIKGYLTRKLDFDGMPGDIFFLGPSQDCIHLRHAVSFPKGKDTVVRKGVVSGNGIQHFVFKFFLIHTHVFRGGKPERS